MITFKSAVTRKLLGYFFLNPHQSLYVNELSRKLELDKRNLVKKLKELEREHIIQYQSRGNLKLYSINRNYPLYDEYKKIIAKTAGLESELRNILSMVGGVKHAYLYGSYARNTMNAHSDIDLLVVGSHKILDLQSRLSGLQTSIGREINAVSMSEDEFKRKLKNKNPFISGILNNKYIQIA